MTLIAEKQKTHSLTPRQKLGIKCCLVGLISVLGLFMIITATGKPIQLLGSIGATLIYQFAIYVPVFVLAGLALKKLSANSKQADQS
jgi:hypothetical protein